MQGVKVAHTAQCHKMRIYVGFLKIFCNPSKLINISKKYYYQWILTFVPSRKGPWGVQEPLKVPQKLKKKHQIYLITNKHVRMPGNDTYTL